MELAGGDDRNHETRVPEDTSYSLQLNIVAANRVRGVGGKPIFLDVLINDQHLEVELDTGARFSVIPEHLWKAKWPEVQLQHIDVGPVAYGGASVQIIGKANVIVSCNKHAFSADVFIVKEGRYSLFGRDLLSRIRLDWPAILDKLHSIAPAPLDVFKSFPDIFADALGCISDCHAKIHLREDAVPKCMPSRPVPYAIRAKVGQELDRL